MEPQQNETESVIAPLKKVTPLSKYLAVTLFIILPFLGGWIGYTYAPEKIVKTQEVVTVEKIVQMYDEEVTGIEKDFKKVVIKDVVNDSVTPLDTMNIFLYNNTLYVLRILPMDEGLSLTPIWRQSTSTDFLYEGGNYINDGTNIIFLGNRLSGPILVKNADATTFYTISPTSEDGGVQQDVLGLDNKSVYYNGEILNGVDPTDINFKSSSYFPLPIIFDEDTYWYPEGNCHGAYYRIGTKEELETYVFPC